MLFQNPAIGCPLLSINRKYPNSGGAANRTTLAAVPRTRRSTWGRDIGYDFLADIKEATFGGKWKALLVPNEGD
ncbi:hypothetical protein E0H38_33185 [Rhizobium leguminosarum bv. viciae]|nr:hypothetical protein E0H38_33185 [Rhizobium leguminosarum bv. viciae]